MRRLLGSYATHTLSLKERTLSPTLLGSRLLTSSASAFMRAFDPAILSAFLNHEPLTIIKASTELLYEPHASLWLSAPELPQLSDDLEYLREYLQPIPLVLSLSSYEAAQLSGELQQVLPAILNWGIDGFQLWFTEAPCEPLCIQKATTAFQENQDPIALFLAQSCQSELEASVPANELHQAYRSWARASSEQALSASRFAARALACGLQQTEQAAGHIYRGLRILPPASP